MTYVEFYDAKGNLDHHAIVTNLHEIEAIADGRLLRFAPLATVDLQNVQPGQSAFIRGEV